MMEKVEDYIPKAGDLYLPTQQSLDHTKNEQVNFDMPELSSNLQQIYQRKSSNGIIIDDPFSDSKNGSIIDSVVEI